jgi:malate dehydrogenase (oxaloacetate-decarboxylating)
VASTSAQFSLVLRVRIAHRPGMLGRVATAIGEAGGTIGSVDLVSLEGEHLLRDIIVDAADEEHTRRIADAVDAVEGAEVVDRTDRTFLMHLGGKIEQRNKQALRTRDDLSMAYTPGVARVCSAIAQDRDKAFQYTIKRNTVAVVSDGSAVLGLGDIGPEAAMPVMEGKAMLFKEFGGVDAFPLCLDTKDPEAIIATVKALAPTFGGINLEDISAPRAWRRRGSCSSRASLASSAATRAARCTPAARTTWTARCRRSSAGSPSPPIPSSARAGPPT